MTGCKKVNDGEPRNITIQWSDTCTYYMPFKPVMRYLPAGQYNTHPASGQVFKLKVVYATYKAKPFEVIVKNEGKIVYRQTDTIHSINFIVK